MKTFTILSKKRKYYAAETESGFKFDLLIDDTDYEVGQEVRAKLEDISVKSKYGTKWIFKIAIDEDEMADGNFCFIRAPFNENLLAKCNELNGEWDGAEQVWLFPKHLEDIVEPLQEEYGEDIGIYEVVFSEEQHEYNAPYHFYGYRLATATGRDSGARLCPEVNMLAGDATSGGSMKNWKTIVSGTFRFPMAKAIAEQAMEDAKEEDAEFTIKYICEA